MMTMSKALMRAGILTCLMASAAFANDKTVKIGVLTDMSSVYSDVTGPGSVVAAQMAVEDSGLLAKGWKIDVLSADHQNKPDVGATIARQWFDIDKIDVITDVPNSGVALAVSAVVREKNGAFLDASGGTVELTNSQCSPNTIHWAFDTYMFAHGTGSALTKAGGDTWFFLAADYTFGATLQRDATKFVEANGGRVIGSVRHPLNTPDFSSFLLQAQSSKAKVIGLANAGGDTANAIKQASEFGLTKGGQKLAALLLFITDVHSLGLTIAQGLNFTDSFYWDMDDNTRAFSRRFQERTRNRQMPTSAQAGVYAALLHYFKVIDAMGGNPHDGKMVIDGMKQRPTDDPLFGVGSIQPNGRKIHPAYLFEVKTPSESKGPWDYFKVIAKIPAEEAFMPLSESKCPLLRKQ
ncbi:MAG: ABC transporter substrate-binding protein [Xanthobacteraceae bacterium]